MAKKKKMNPDDFDIGYGKPPASTQFKSGKSGNPSGRPKGSKSFEAHVRAELSRRVPVTEGGKQRSMSKRQVIAKHVVNKAASGDHKVIPMISNIDRDHESAAASAGQFITAWDTPEDLLLLQRAKQRMLADEAHAPAEEATEPRKPKSDDPTEGGNNV